MKRAFLIPSLLIALAWSAQATTIYLGQIDISGEFTRYRNYSTPGTLPFGKFSGPLSVQSATGIFADTDPATFTMNSPYLWDDENWPAPMVWHIEGQNSDFVFETTHSALSTTGWGALSINGFDPESFYSGGNYLTRVFAGWEFRGPAIHNPFSGPDVIGPMTLQINFGYYDNPPNVPETGSTLAMLGITLVALGILRIRK